MTRARWSWFALLSCLCLVACEGSEDDTEPEGAGGNTSTGGGTGASLGGGTSASTESCESGCRATMSADCSNGPPSQEVCVLDCEALSASNCGTSFLALQACAEGEVVTCSTEGLPVVAACAAEQAAFVACLGG